MGRQKEFDREEVLQKAMELFWKNGYHATSMQELVDHLGIHRASIYDAFGNKQKLYEEAFALYREKNVKYLQRFLNEQSEPKIGLRKLLIETLDESLNDADRKGCFAVNCIGEYLPSNMEFVGELLDNKKNFESIIIDFLKKGKASGQLDATLNLKSFASFLYTFFSGLKVITKMNQNRAEMLRNIDLALGHLDVA